MNRLEYYNRQKEYWSDKEIQELKTEYEIERKTISQIGDNHHRTPGSISYKLKNLGIITHNTLSRGYFDYKNSDLYKQIVEKGKSSDAEKNIKNRIKLQMKNETLPHVNTSFKEILEIRNEIAHLKTDMKEMLRVMNSIYERVSH